MAIDPKELQLKPRFKAFGLFSEVREREVDGEQIFSYAFDFKGGSFTIEVPQAEFLSAPVEGTPFYVEGNVIYSSYNGTIRLKPDLKKQVTEIKPEDFAKGVIITGCGTVELKKSTIINRKPFLKTTISFLGGLHTFTDIVPETFLKLPARGYVRFWWGLTTLTQKIDGVQQQSFVPFLADVRGEEVATAAGVAEPQPARKKPE